jgi:carbon starvation protein CstA
MYALAYRCYSALIAAKAMMLGNQPVTPTHIYLAPTYEVGHKPVPSTKWVWIGEGL